MTLTITPAKRKAVPMLISLAGVSAAEKTYSALLLASGLPARRNGWLPGHGEWTRQHVRRQSSIQAALSNGYEIAEMREPFAPRDTAKLWRRSRSTAARCWSSIP